MRVTLVNPYNVGRLGLQNILQLEPLGLQVMGAALADHHDVNILDLRWEPEFERSLSQTSPDVIGISCLYTSHIGATWDLARRAKTVLPGATVVVGGHPPTLAPEFFNSEHIDAVVVGDGELTLPDVCAAVERGGRLDSVQGLVVNAGGSQKHTAKRLRPSDLTTTPAALRGMPGVHREKTFLSLTRPIALVELTRGCAYRCNFCSIWQFADGTVRPLAIEKTVEEIAALEENSVFFADDHFFHDAEFMTELGHALHKAGVKKYFNVQTRADVVAKNPQMIDIWKEIGLHAVFLGFDGHSDLRLKEVRKGGSQTLNEQAVDVLHERDVGVVGNVMVDPKFTREDFREARAYIRDRNYHFVTWCISTPFPGTETWRTRRGEVTTLDFDLYDIAHAVTRTTLPLPEFYEEFAECWRQRKALQPKGSTWRAVKQFTKTVFRDGLNLQLVKNARRFDRSTCTPGDYLADHAASERKELPWARGGAAEPVAAAEA